MMHPLLQLVKDQKRGMVSLCTANRFVLQAAMINAKAHDEPVLIEATANQVNQFGGYTGMTPRDFKAFVEDIADTVGFDKTKIILGGDHLGPLTFADKPETEAMALAHELIRQYVRSGFTKIHIDTSMKLADDDKDARLSDAVIAKRGAALCSSAEKAYVRLKAENPAVIAPVYIIGSEVPIPGGMQEAEDDGISVTKPDEFKRTVAEFKAAYDASGLQDAWVRVVAVVVQPGVEFGDATIDAYNRSNAKPLIDMLNDFPGIIFEGHSTDYQTPVCLKQMVEDRIGILKVGPALTFALREALFALADIEDALAPVHSFNTSDFKKILDNAMTANPEHWEKHYHGSPEQLAFKRQFSLSDRSRYYLPDETVDSAISSLIENLNEIEIPLSLLSQYMPVQYTKVRSGRIKNNPTALIYDRISNCIDEYAFACGRK